MEPTKGVEKNCEAGVSMVVVKGAVHHVQNDFQAERAAEVLRVFMGGLRKGRSKSGLGFERSSKYCRP
jgi:hypothetical protein